MTLDDIIRWIQTVLLTIIFILTPGPYPNDYQEPTGRYEPTPTATPSPSPKPTSKPTPTPTQRIYKQGKIGGTASYYATGRDGRYGAAGPALRRALRKTFGFWRGLTVLVCKGKRCIQVKLNDFCRCNTRKEKLIDLSDEAFSYLAPLSRGVITVTVGW